MPKLKIRTKLLKNLFISLHAKIIYFTVTVFFYAIYFNVVVGASESELSPYFNHDPIFLRVVTSEKSFYPNIEHIWC